MSITRPRVALAALAAAATLALGVSLASSPWGEGRPAPDGGTVVRRGAAYVETRLFFGTARSNGGEPVTERRFLDFVDRRVTPRFPDGLTLRDGRGQWRDRHGTIVRERSYELVLLYPGARARERDTQIEDIRGAYEREFGQESVARADEPAWVDF
ncbi:DUF3574 domain-containing protein [Streptomyces sp. NPDC057702]|uniref:DUF3574 domain-containing protein n=1 Tax=unclassified Streptomyces TaxID=2593676 RepID=UPI00368F71AC